MSKIFQDRLKLIEVLYAEWSADGRPFSKAAEYMKELGTLVTAEEVMRLPCDECESLQKRLDEIAELLGFADCFKHGDNCQTAIDTARAVAKGESK